MVALVTGTVSGLRRALALELSGSSGAFELQDTDRVGLEQLAGNAERPLPFTAPMSVRATKWTL